MTGVRTTVVVLTTAVLFVAAGCGDGGKKSTTTTTTENAALKLGMVTDVSGLNDRGFNALAYRGLKQAQRELGAQIQVAESKSPADYVPNLASFARRGYDLVIGVGYTEIAAMGAVAKRFPDTHFAIVDVSNKDLAGAPPNVLGLLFHEEQVGYLAGYLAGLEAKRLPGPDVVSSVAGEKQPPVDRFIAGYQAGAKHADPGSRRSTATRRTSTTRRSARRSRSTRSRPARSPSSRSPAFAALARSTQPGSKACGGSASTPTSHSSARTS